jgi:hypothetical protein
VKERLGEAQRGLSRRAIAASAGAKTAKIAVFTTKWRHRPGTIPHHFRCLCNKFVTYRINGIFPPINGIFPPINGIFSPINEFSPPHQIAGSVAHRAQWRRHMTG